jgi:hypothetical protein
MTEKDWLANPDPDSMLTLLWHQRKLRKLRLFGCACCRRVWDLFSNKWSRAAIEAAEHYADGLIAPAEIEGYEENACGVVRAELVTGDRQSVRIAAIARALSTSRLLHENWMNHLGHELALSVTWAMGQTSSPEAIATERGSQAGLLRHMIGNPFRPYPAPPSWPSTVVQLAESLYAGQDCAFALHDALLEAGHAELAEHFREEKSHPKGCWVVDLILGKK